MVAKCKSIPFRKARTLLTCPPCARQDARIPLRSLTAIALLTRPDPAHAKTCAFPKRAPPNNGSLQACSFTTSMEVDGGFFATCDGWPCRCGRPGDGEKQCPKVYSNGRPSSLVFSSHEVDSPRLRLARGAARCHGDRPFSPAQPWRAKTRLFPRAMARRNV
jgi:hypothetical protein